MVKKRNFGAQSEHEAQVQFVKLVRLKYPDHWVFAVPNGGWRFKSQAIKFKSEGVSSGVPDLFIPSLRLWIEMKKNNQSKLSKTQKLWKEYLLKHGYHYIVGYGFDDAAEKLARFVGRNSGDSVNDC